MSIESKAFRTPGQLVQALLEDRGWSQRALAIVLDMDETGINRICADKRSVDAKLAIALEDVFGVSADRFLELQRAFDLAQARIVALPDPTRADRAQLYGDLPITEMIRRGWIDAKDIRDPKVASELMRFFGVNRIEDIEILPHAAKKTEVSSPATPAQMAWLYRVKQIASEMLVGAPYSQHGVKAAIDKLKTLTASAEEARKVPRILSECGIRFVLVETLTSAKIDGVCFWLNEGSPVIGMTMRHDRIDNFWFVLRHELEHVIQGHGRNAVMMDAELEGERAGTGSGIAEEERIANEAAAAFCVSPAMLEAFIARKAPFFAEKDLVGFARILKVHPGLVAGQLQHAIKRYDRFRDHLVKIRAIVAPNAFKDGWGDVAPVEQ